MRFGSGLLTWRIRWPTGVGFVAGGVMCGAASIAAAQINAAQPPSTPLEGITVSLTVAILAGMALLGTGAKVAKAAGELASEVRGLRAELASQAKLQDERHEENVRRLERLEGARR